MYQQGSLTYPGLLDFFNSFRRVFFRKYLKNKNPQKENLHGNPTCANGTALTDYFNSPAVKEN